MPKRGLLIALEGIDGSGTTSQISPLADHIRSLSKYNGVLLTREPWNNEEIKRRLEQDSDAYSGGMEMTKLCLDDRVNHNVQLISPVIRAGQIVLTDRYDMSTFAYQQTQGTPIGEIRQMRANRSRDIIIPDLTIYLDVDFETSTGRILKRGEGFEKFEKDSEFVLDLIENYRKLARKNPKEKYLGRIVKVDGNNPLEEVSAAIAAEFDKIYGPWTNS